MFRNDYFICGLLIFILIGIIILIVRSYKSCHEKYDGWMGNEPPPLPTVLPATQPTATTLSGIGVNLIGPEARTVFPGTYNTDYVYPNIDELKYYNARGLRLIRLPLRLERMQNQLFGDLNQDNITRTHNFLQQAQNLGMKTILVIYNSGRWYNDVIGSPGAPVSAFTDFWKKMASEFKSHTPYVLYDLMSRPQVNNWPTVAQAAVNAIREVDLVSPIIVSGQGTAEARTFPENNPNLNIQDPSNNILYEAQQFFDQDGSGNYQGQGDFTDVMIGVNRLQPFINWLNQKGARGFIGEYNVPPWAGNSLEVLNNFMKELKKYGIPSTLWAGGPAVSEQNPARLDPIFFAGQSWPEYYSQYPISIDRGYEMPQVRYAMENNFV